MMFKNFQFLFNRKLFLNHFVNNVLKSSETSDSVLGLIKAKISLSGPMSVADYMKIVLTSQTGYYMINDVFGSKGDFVTSPEISQLFGEMIGVWAVNELSKLGSPKPLRLVELGPGRGTMTQDILRVLRKLGFTSDLSVNLVELSPVLSRIQSEKLCEKSFEVNNKLHYREGVTTDGIKVLWYKSIKDLPQEGFICLLANEFFDALPIHKFQKTKDGWREVLIDLDNTNVAPKLKFIVSRHPTPISVLFNQKYSTGERDHVEFCPEAGIIMENLANRFEEYGGMALIVDYGHYGDKTDTFRAFKDHKLHDPLIDPGTADLTADVDFFYLKNLVKEKLISFGPANQADFLSKLHIETRLKVLIENSRTEENKNKLLSSYNMLMAKNGMGERFKVMALFPAVLRNYLKEFPVQGF